MNSGFIQEKFVSMNYQCQYNLILDAKISQKATSHSSHPASHIHSLDLVTWEVHVHGLASPIFN